ncbi:MAG: tRNA glutamyl-Q(34) synthetase GluQRS [Akkermansiaceae bacterium]
MRTRFAPSPTGHLHLGHAFAAYYAHQLAASNNGEFLLRFEDIDTTRTRAEYYTAIEQDLQWLGLPWKTPTLRQTERLTAYTAALEKLQSLGIVYPCFCTRSAIKQELSQITNAPHGPEGPLYPGTCKQLTQATITSKLANDEPHCWRLNATHAHHHTGALTFTDAIHGTIKVEHALLGDVILSRKDIATSYHLAVVVDDAYQEITHVTRGEDLLPSTHVHRILQTLLDLPEPIYHHHRLIMDASGQRLAKRSPSSTLRELRESGLSLAEVLAMLDK